MVFLLILGSLILLDGLCWRWLDRRLRVMKHGPAMRIALAIFMATQMAVFLWLIIARMSYRHGGMPVPLLILVYVWHVVVLPIMSAIIAAMTLVKDGWRLVRWIGSRRKAAANAPPPPALPAGEVCVLSRRGFLTATAAFVPPAVALVGAGNALDQLRRFRIRRIDVPLRNLPPAMEGFTIAQVSDIHVGSFTHGRGLGDIVDSVNALEADLVCVTGNLIDFYVRDLREAMKMAQGFRGRFGVYVCEGNHDLFQDREYFEQAVRDAGLKLLVNEDEMRTIERCGHTQKLQNAGIALGHTDAAQRDSAPRRRHA